MTTRTIATTTPRDTAFQKINALGDFAPLELAEVLALLECDKTTFGQLQVPAAEIGPRTKRWLWGTLKQGLKDAERSAA